jgi:hypothetical protein
MSDKVHYLHGGGGGPEDPMLEQRVGRLVADVTEIRSDVREIRTDIRQISERIGRIEERMGRMEVGTEKLGGRVENLPSTWTFIVSLIMCLLAGLAVAIGLR